MEDHRKGGHLPVAPLLENPMSELWRGVDNQVHDGQLQTIEQNGARDLLRPTNSQSYGTPPADV